MRLLDFARYEPRPVLLIFHTLSIASDIIFVPSHNIGSALLVRRGHGCLLHLAFLLELAGAKRK